MYGFFGLLDIPLITLGCPLILYFLLKDKTTKGDIEDIVQFSFLWLLGYGLTWLTKWILMDIFYHRSLIQTALGQIVYRTVGGSFSSLFAIAINVINMVIPMMIMVIIIMYFSMKYYKNIN